MHQRRRIGHADHRCRYRHCRRIAAAGDQNRQRGQGQQRQRAAEPEQRAPAPRRKNNRRQRHRQRDTQRQPCRPEPHGQHPARAGAARLDDRGHRRYDQRQAKRLDQPRGEEQIPSLREGAREATERDQHQPRAARPHRSGLEREDAENRPEERRPEAEERKIPRRLRHADAELRPQERQGGAGLANLHSRRDPGQKCRGDHWPVSMPSGLVHPCATHLRIRARIISAAFSAIIVTGAWVLPEGIVGITEASAIESPAMPCTVNSGETTAPGSQPIRAVETG